MRMSIDELIQRVGQLPPLPQAAQKALKLIQNPDTNMVDIGNVIAMDQVMASLVLRWANSAYYGLTNRVSTVQQAVVYLGQNTVQSLLLTASVMTYLDRPVPGYGLERGELWKHSVGVAGGARLVAAKFGRKVAEEAYHAGLLCDIGKLAFEVLLRTMDSNDPNWQGKSFSELEQTYFGIDHAVLGGEMARRWKLPESLVSAIIYHHRPSLAGENAVIASAVHIADSAMMMLGIGIGKDGLQYDLDPEAISILGWNENNLEDLFDRVSALVKEAEQFIGLVRK